MTAAVKDGRAKPSVVTLTTGRGAPSRRVRILLQVGPFLLVLAALVVFPVVLLVTYSFRSYTFLGAGSGPTLEQFRLVLETWTTVRLMLRTLALTIVVSGIVTLLSFVISYAITFRMRARRSLVVIGVIVASGFASFLTRIFAWGSLLGTDGLVNKALMSTGLVHAPLQFLYFNYFAVGITMVYLYLPAGVLVVFSAMQKVDPREIEASHDLGAGRWKTVREIIGPQIRFGLLGAFFLTLVSVAGDFVTPQLVGGVQGFTVGSQVQDLALEGGNVPEAAALSFTFLLMIGIAVAVAGLLWRLARVVWPHTAERRHRLVLSLPRIRTPKRHRLPPIRASLSGIATGFLLVYLLVPTVLVVIFSFSAGTTASLPIPGLTTHWYPQAVHTEGFSQALDGSISIAIIAVIGSTALAVPVAFALARVRGRARNLLWVAVSVPFLIPPVLLGSALLVAATDTGIPLGIGYTAAAQILLLISETIIIVYARIQGIDANLLDAARDLGANARRSLRNITLPLLFPSIVGAALLAVAYSLDELFVTSFTIGQSNTLPIWLFSQARRGFNPSIDAIGVMMLGGTLLCFAAAVRVARKSILRTNDG